MITISPRQTIANEYFTNGYTIGAFEGGVDLGPIFDICAYDTKSRAWYYLFCLFDRGIADKILREVTNYSLEYVYKDNTIFCCQFYNCNFWSDIACIASIERLFSCR